MSEIENIIKILSVQKLPLQNEKISQSEIYKILLQNGIDSLREYHLDAQNIPDFYLPESGIAIEVKIKGGRQEIYKQCKRYCEFESVKQLILLTNRSMGFPSKISEKPCYIINMGRAWL